MEVDSQPGGPTESDTAIEAEEFLGYWLNDAGT